MKEPTLLIGATGLLGSSVARRLQELGRTVVAPDRLQVDLADPGGIAEPLERWAPGAVINTAAFADVNLAERHEHRAEVFRVNRDGPHALAVRCAERGIRLVHVSTDYVFDGEIRRPYREDDTPRPLQVYGESKLAGERRVLGACPDALIVRTSTLFGPGRPGRAHYIDAVLRQAETGDSIEVVAAPVSSPTYTPDLAKAILALLERRISGIVHAVNVGSCSRLELARAAVELSGWQNRVRVHCRPEPQGALRRPAYSVLDDARFAAATGFRLRGWRDALADYLGSARNR